MSRNRLFDWGKPYLLTDLKEGLFIDEPAICVGKKDSDMERPTLCAVCGEPLGSTGYYSFFLMGPNGHGKDMMIGGGCIRDRIRSRELDTEGVNFRDTWNRTIAKFPQSGRWYGTFLHHCIAKPYVRNKNVVEKWDESILKLPGVRYIMKVIDELRDEGWNLDAEMVLECGRVDLLATHPDKGVAVFDWKSDICFDNHEAYIDQVNMYMTELSNAGFRKITGYILWIMKETKENVPFKGFLESFDKAINRSYAPSLPCKCTLNIEMNGGGGIDKKRMTEYSHHRVYGDEVTFFIPQCEPWKHGYDLEYFEASPYREDERPQPFRYAEAEEGLHISFICSKKRHSFNLTAHWKRIRPFDCTLSICPTNYDPNSYLTLHKMSEIDPEGNDYVNFDVRAINCKLKNKVITHATLAIDPSLGVKTEWSSEELQDEMKINIPCVDGRSHFRLMIETERIEKKKKSDPQPVANIFEKELPDLPITPNTYVSSSVNVDDDWTRQVPESFNSTSYVQKSFTQSDPAEQQFTPGRIYKSGERYYGIYKRKDSDRRNTVGKVDVAEVDIHGKKISNLEWRYVYLTSRRKEYIYSPTDRRWKVYTTDVLVDLAPEDMDRFG